MSIFPMANDMQFSGALREFENQRNQEEEREIEEYVKKNNSCEDDDFDRF
jgi:hypothetical protein